MGLVKAVVIISWILLDELMDDKLLVYPIKMNMIMFMVIDIIEKFGRCYIVQPNGESIICITLHS